MAMENQTLLLMAGAIGLGWGLHLVVYSGRQRSASPPGRPTNSGRVVMYSFVASVAFMFGLLGWDIAGAGQDDSNWVKTRGTIIAFEVEDIDQNRGLTFSGDITDPLYLVRLEYTYIVDGVAYIGNRQLAHQRLRDGRLELEPDELEAAEQRYLPGKAVDVYYNPDTLAEAALERTNKTPYLAVGMGGGMAGGLVAGFFLFPVTQYLFSKKGDSQAIAG
jgi:hypothetical protein